MGWKKWLKAERNLGSIRDRASSAWFPSIRQQTSLYINFIPTTGLNSDWYYLLVGQREAAVSGHIKPSTAQGTAGRVLHLLAANACAVDWESEADWTMSNNLNIDMGAEIFPSPLIPSRIFSIGISHRAISWFQTYSDWESYPGIYCSPMVESYASLSIS